MHSTNAWSGAPSVDPRLPNGNPRAIKRGVQQLGMPFDICVELYAPLNPAGVTVSTHTDIGMEPREVELPSSAPKVPRHRQQRETDQIASKKTIRP